MAAPVVSFVIINYNYGEFVATAIDSVLSQTYERFECIVFDNCSTDNSRAVIEPYIGRDNRLRVEFHQKNLNQMGAFLKVLDELRGDYVTIVDADDFLFPGYAAHHLAAHQMIRGGIGFTSSCVIEVDSLGAPLTGGYSPFLNDANWIEIPETVRKDPDAGTLSNDEIAALRNTLKLANPDTNKWRWSPGTANMHRIENIRAFRPVNHKEIYVAATDNYFMWLNHVYANSAQIQIPLSAYRHHGRNRYGAMPSIPGLTIGTQQGVNRSFFRLRDITLTLASRAREFCKLAPGRFWRLMDAPLANDLDRKRYFSQPAVEKIIRDNYDELLAAFGREELEKELRLRRK